MIEYLLLAIGIVLLIKGADFLVDGSSALAKKFGIPTLIIGLTIVAFGTSMPELVINVIAAIKGNGNIAFGNVIGSNIANILLILGITSIITKIKVQHSTVWREIPFSLIAAIILFVFASNYLPIDNSQKALSVTEGIILLLFFSVFLYYVFEMARKGKNKELRDEKIEIKKLSSLMIAAYIIGGLIALYFGGKFTVEGAIALARFFGMSEYFISLTIVAIGTSLPELITSIIAAIKKDDDLAVGNVVGSNIFNIFLVLGVSALINPIIIPATAIFDLSVLLITTTLLFLFMFVGTKHELKKWQGIAFIGLYVAYIIFLLIRG
jgi:cation:H+ antiporter